MKIQIDFDTDKLKNKINSRVKRARVVLAQQVAKDSNFYCPEAEHLLQDSVMDSDWASGVLEWDTKYAKAQYYGLPNKSKDKNPNARMNWFEHAKTAKLKNWGALAYREYNK